MAEEVPIQKQDEKEEEANQKEKEEAIKAKQEAAKLRAEKEAQRSLDRERNSKILAQIRDFQSSKIVTEHMRLTNDVLTIVQSTSLELLDGLIQHLVCIFESFVPDL